MTTKRIVHPVLGAQAELALRREVDMLGDLLRRSGVSDVETPGGRMVDVVGHLADGAQRLADAWGNRLATDVGDVLLHTLDDPVQQPERGPLDEEVIRWRNASEALLEALGGCRQDDWSWPVWSPLGGIETLAESARRWVAHQVVHHTDVAVAVGLFPRVAEEAEVLAAEFVLDAVARRGGDVVVPPLDIAVHAGYPGAGSWTLIFEQPKDRIDVSDVWHELVGTRPQALETHRVERGVAAAPRLTIRTEGGTLWRAAFRRGASWADLEVHGDDEARRAWRRLLAAVSGGGDQGLRTVA